MRQKVAKQRKTSPEFKRKAIAMIVEQRLISAEVARSFDNDSVCHRCAVQEQCDKIQP